MAEHRDGPQQQAINEANRDTQMTMENSIEYKVLQAYTERKKNPHSHPLQINGATEGKPASPVPMEKHHKAKKKDRRRRIKLSKLLHCFQPAKDDHVPVAEDIICRPATDTHPKQEVEEIVNKLTKITDSVHFLPTEIMCDANDSEIERIVEILREHGDILDEEIKKNHMLMQELQRALSYDFYKKIAKVFFKRLCKEELPPTKQPKQAQIALICELTSRLKIMDSHPMNRVLGFGAQYLRDYYTAWVTDQGGYGEVFSTDDDAEEEVQ